MWREEKVERERGRWDKAKPSLKIKNSLAGGQIGGHAKLRGWWEEEKVIPFIRL